MNKNDSLKFLDECIEFVKNASEEEVDRFIKNYNEYFAEKNFYEEIIDADKFDFEFEFDFDLEKMLDCNKSKYNDFYKKKLFKDIDFNSLEQYAA